MPRTKNRISIKKNEYKQKQLLLWILKELYFAFKHKYPKIKIVFF